MNEQHTTTPSPEAEWSQVEKVGVDPVAADARNGRRWHLFFGWFLPGLSVLYLGVGAALGRLGLSTTQIVLAAILGTATSMLLAGVIAGGSARTGTPTAAIGRALSPNGHVIRAFFSWAFSVTIATTGIVAATLTMTRVVAELGWIDADWVKPLALVVIGATVSVVATSGHEAMIWARLSFGVLGAALTATFLTQALREVETTSVPTGSWVEFGIAVAAIASLTGLIWPHVAGDLARYQPVRGIGTVAGISALGGSIGPIALITIGSLLGSASTTVSTGLTSDPIGTMSDLLPRWVVLAFGVTAALAVMGLATSGLYGAGLTALSVGIRTTRGRATLGSAMLAVVAAAVVLFALPDVWPLATALLILAVPVVAWAGVTVMGILTPSNNDLVRTLTLIVAVAVGWPLAGNSPTILSGRWALGIVAALGIGMLGGLLARVLPQPAPDQPEPDSDAPMRALETDDDYPDDTLARGDLLAARVDLPPEQIAAEIEAILSPAPQRGIAVDDPDELPQYEADESRGLAGIYRSTSFDDEQHDLADEPRPSRAMSDEEQTALENMLEATGTWSLYIDDGSADSPARPRRRVVEE